MSDVSSHFVDVIVDKVRIGGVYLEDDQLGSTVSRSSLSHLPFVSPRTCGHPNVAEGWAYFDFAGEHWPILVCRDCRIILAGRHPYVERRRRHAWERPTEEDLAADLIASKWGNSWPKRGRPRARKHPPGLVWPEQPLSDAA